MPQYRTEVGDLGYNYAPRGGSGGFAAGSVSSLTEVVRQLSVIESARKINVSPIAPTAACVGVSPSSVTKNTNSTDPASAVST
ncbi:MAG: hypothetical protein CFE26_22905 [Verrucomicrobiales bacterium VVV1]|nr:MAG: hypothetical protein CFE26_22905 [Verrucomicrobiales bacterium VVV1]